MERWKGVVEGREHFEGKVLYGEGLSKERRTLKGESYRMGILR